ncbi:MAG: extracellular solute-binding protein [Oscillospiraceae bacterium]|nr:extracellular solute-binding protein [Oscillospiraceae bacterium]
MKNLKLKLSAVILLASLILCANIMASCGGEPSGNDGGGENPANAPAAGGDNNIPAEIPAQEPEPDIPVVDMNGKEITIALLNWYNYKPLDIVDIDVEELAGEPFNDAAYNRNLFMEQTYNCNINAVSFPDCSTALNGVRRTIQAGDGVYDIVSLRAYFYMPILTGGLTHSFDDMPYIELDNPWWYKDAVDVTSVGQKAYALLGDYTTAIMNCVWNTYFNKKLISDFGLENPYQLVKDGEWTLSKMYEMGKEVAADLNSDGTMDTEDRYGIIHIVETPISILNSFGERFVDLDSDGAPYLSLARESAMEKFVHLVEIFSDRDTCFNVHYRTNDPARYEAQMFVNNQALFCLGGIYYGPEMRAMDEEYGILPFPKYDESQKEYYNSTNVRALPLLTVPITNGDLENTGLFLEAFAYQGYKNVRPEFYDVLLQRKVARDDESAEMLDFIFSNIFMDVGAMYNFGGISDSLNDMTGQSNSNIASYLERNSERITREIQKFIDAISE